MARAREAELSAAADHVVTISRALRDDLVAVGVPAERISLVPNAVDASLLERSANGTTPSKARARLGLPEDGFWVGTVSSIVDYEGLDVLVRAVALLRQEGLPVRCAIVGDGVARPGLGRLAARLGIEDLVLLPGRVPRDEAIAWHQALDAFVVPRLDTEVCRTVTPLKPIEAMALGRPVVASDLPALAEVVAEPATGLVAAPGDPVALAAALHRLATDPDLVARLGAQWPALRTDPHVGGAGGDVPDDLRAVGSAPWRREHRRTPRQSPLADLDVVNFEQVDISRLSPVGVRPGLGTVHGRPASSGATSSGPTPAPGRSPATRTRCSATLWLIGRPILDGFAYYVIFGVLLGTSRGVDNYVGLPPRRGLPVLLHLPFPDRGRRRDELRQEPHPGLLLPQGRHSRGAAASARPCR